MLSKLTVRIGFMALTAVFLFTGCQPESAPAPQEAPPVGSDENAAVGEEAEIAAALAKLSPEDRAKAEAQRMCPVGDARLGSMDAPYKMSVNGHDVFLCCEGCKGEVEANPEEVLAKLGLPPTDDSETR